MDTLTFFSELIKAISWPLIVIVIFLFLKEPIGQLIPLLQRLRYKSLELEFGRKVSELAVEADEEIPEGHPIEEFTQEDSRMMHLTQISPRAAVLEAWINLEKSAVDTLRRKEMKLPKARYISPGMIARLLQRARVLDKKKMSIFNELRTLRNMAAHTVEFYLDPDAVSEFVDLANRLAGYITRA